MKKMFAFLMIIVASGTIVLAGGYFYLKYEMNKVQKLSTPNSLELIDKNTQNLNQDLPDTFNVLLLGIDSGDLGRDEKGRSDTMLVANLNLKQHKVNLVSVERDTLTEIVGTDTKGKLNSAYNYGGVDMALKSTEKLLSINIPYYMTINMKGLKQILDEIGPIEVNNEFSFEFDGHEFQEGSLILNADESLAWIRMRYDDPNGDYGRQIRQQEVIKGILNEVTTINGIKKIDSLTTILGKNMDTNLPLEKFVSYVPDMLINKINLNTDQLKGYEEYIDGVSYQIMEQEELNRISEKLTGGVDKYESKIKSDR